MTESSSEELVAGSRAPGSSRPRLYAGLISLSLLIALIFSAKWIVQRRIICADPACDQRPVTEFYLVSAVGSLCVFFAAYLLLPYFDEAYRWLKGRWRPVYTGGAVAGACAALSAFILYYGNRQFGGYDFSALIDIGWRLVSGQTPYTDFVCTTPPGFFLGLKYAFILFGDTWNAQLWFTALFSVVTFVWLFCLFAALVQTQLAAFLLALSIECAAMLTMDFWWYNSIAEIAACLFFLSCLVYLEGPGERKRQASYVLSLALLGLMKPNVAGLLSVGAVVLVFVATRHKAQFTVLTAAAVAVAVAFLTLNHVSIRGLIESYAAAAVGRGALSMFGFRSYGFFHFNRVILCVIALATPVWFGIPTLLSSVRRVDIHAIARPLLYVLAVLVSVFAMFWNGDLKDIEWTLFIAAGGVVVYRNATRAGLARNFYTAFLIALAFSDIHMGVVRIRVDGIGRHMYFEWLDDNKRVHVPFFRDLRASTRFQAVVDQVQQALQTNPQPVFFGPRMEFAYAAFHVPSPLYLPVWWDPGTSFAAKREPELLGVWQARRFGTLIFLKDDFTYYSPQFLQIINTLYVRDDNYSELTIFHAREP